METTRYIGSRSFTRVNDSEVWKEICGKCGGTGYIESYRHIDNGVCYSCGGNPVLARFTTAELDKKLDQRNKREAKKEAARLAVCAERDARVARLQAAEPEVALALSRAYEDYQTDAEPQPSAFLVDLSRQIHNAEGRDLTENQIAAVKRTLVSEQERAVNKAASEYLPGEVGTKATVEGEVVFTKVIESQYGSSLLIIVKVSDTIKVKMFTTAAWAWEMHGNDVGGELRVEVTGTIKAHEVYNGEKSTQLVRVKGVVTKYVPA